MVAPTFNFPVAYDTFYHSKYIKKQRKVSVNIVYFIHAVLNLWFSKMLIFKVVLYLMK